MTDLESVFDGFGGFGSNVRSGGFLGFGGFSKNGGPGGFGGFGRFSWNGGLMDLMVRSVWCVQLESWVQ